MSPESTYITVIVDGGGKGWRVDCWDVVSKIIDWDQPFSPERHFNCNTVWSSTSENFVHVTSTTSKAFVVGRMVDGWCYVVQWLWITLMRDISEIGHQLSCVLLWDVYARTRRIGLFHFILWNTNPTAVDNQHCVSKYHRNAYQREIKAWRKRRLCLP